MKKCNSTNTPSCLKKNIIVLSLTLVCYLILYWTPYEMLILPFQKLPQKFELPTFPSYMLLSSGFILIAGLAIMFTLFLFFQEKGKVIYQRVFNFTFYLGIAILLLSAIPRYYLSKKVDNSNYVRCSEESFVSAKVSWNVYAESEDLCKSK